jgi:hypothetical protein
MIRVTNIYSLALLRMAGVKPDAEYHDVRKHRYMAEFENEALVKRTLEFLNEESPIATFVKTLDDLKNHMYELRKESEKNQ